MATITYETKYNVGDKFFVVDKGRKLCPTCLCYHDHYFVYEATIENIDIGYLGVQYWTSLKLSNNCTKSMNLSDFQFYKSKEDAQKKCDYENAKLLKEKKQYMKYLIR